MDAAFRGSYLASKFGRIQLYLVSTRHCIYAYLLELRVMIKNLSICHDVKYLGVTIDENLKC